MKHDARGNTASETRPGGVSIATTYDAYGRLTSYSRTGEASLIHAYNGLDDRVATTRGVETRRYIYDMDGRVIGEYGTSATDVKAEFIWLHPDVANDNQPSGGDDGTDGYAPLAVATGPTTTPTLQWVHGTHLGVPTVYSDATGTATTTPAGYDLPGFPGQSRTLADLYYNRYRDYDTTTGRYIQADPIGLAGGPSPYSYAMNNPVRYTDPLGLVAVCNYSGQSVLVGGTAGPGHGHPGTDQWGTALLPNGQCVSKRNPLPARDKDGNPCVIQDIDSIDLNDDGVVRWPSLNNWQGWWSYLSPRGESFRGGDNHGGIPLRDSHIVLFPYLFGPGVDWLPTIGGGNP